MLKAARGIVHMYLQSVPANGTDSRTRHAVRGELLLTDGGYQTDAQQSFLVRGEYNVTSGRLLMVGTPQILTRYIRSKYLNTSRVVPVYEETQQQLAMFLEPKMRALTAQDRAELETKSFYSPGLLDPEWDPLRTEINSSSCVLLMELRFAVDRNPDDWTPRTYDDIMDLHKVSVGSVFSPSCHVSLDISVATRTSEIIHERAMVFAVTMTVVALCQMVSYIRQIHYTTTHARVSRVSFWMVAQQAALDVMWSGRHSRWAAEFDASFKAFSFAGFVKFAMFMVFQIRYLQSIYKSQLRPGDQSGNDARCFILKIQVGMMLCFLAIWRIGEIFGPICLLPLYSFWWPQIILNVQRNAHRPLELQFIIIQSITRLWLPSYLWLRTENIFDYKQRPGFACLLIGYVLLQSTLLLIQHFYGSTSFIPSVFLPVKFNYHRPLPKRDADVEDPGDDQEEQHECVICKSEVDTEAPPTEYMATPCQHIFHAECLQQWMQYKMECPVCRGALPDN